MLYYTSDILARCFTQLLDGLVAAAPGPLACPSCGARPFSTQISLEGTGSFGVLYRFAWYNLYVHCTVRASWIDVGPVLEMYRT